MLVRLTPTQVANYWEGFLKESVRCAMPSHAEQTNEAMNNVLSSLLADMMQCWVVREDGKIKGVITTYISDEPMSKTRNLLIYSLTLTFHRTDLYEDMFETLTKFARGKGCSKIYAYVQYPHIVEIAEKYGAQTQTLCAVQL